MAEKTAGSYLREAFKPYSVENISASQNDPQVSKHILGGKIFFSPRNTKTLRKISMYSALWKISTLFILFFFEGFPQTIDTMNDGNQKLSVEIPSLKKVFSNAPRPLYTLYRLGPLCRSLKLLYLVLILNGLHTDQEPNLGLTN